MMAALALMHCIPKSLYNGCIVHVLLDNKRLYGTEILRVFVLIRAGVDEPLDPNKGTPGGVGPR
jgi:hypothetical protein